MSNTWRNRLAAMLSHGALAAMYALGLTLTLLSVMGLTSSAPVTVAVTLLTIAACVSATLGRRAALLVSCGAAGMVLVGLVLGGLGRCVEVLRAVSLEMSGVPGALPLVAGETAFLIALIGGAAAFFLTHPSAGPYPALVLLLLSVVLIWLGDRADALWWLIPSVVAVVVMLLLSGHDEVSMHHVLPLAAVTVLLSYAGVALGGVAIGPMKDAADALREKIYDLFFYTEPRDAFSLASLGYYPQGQGQLGGAAEPSEQPVMVVATPRKVYLRGVVKNTYTGRMWLDDTENKRYLWSNPQWSEIRAKAFDTALPAVQNEAYESLISPVPVTVRMLSDSASSMFLPQRLRVLTVQSDLTVYFNVGSEVFATRNLTLGDVWTARAPLMQSNSRGVSALIAACESASDPGWEYVNSTYRQLPPHMEQEVYDVAYAAVSGASTPYEKAMALQNFLQQNYTYNLDVADQPPELDFVSTFLLLGKEGYCTYFASAMTVMCRMVGLPARYVEGFAAVPDENGQAIVTGLDGHAWTEVYFKGFGWLTFDATPIDGQVSYVSPDQPDEPSDPAPSDSPEPTSSPSPSPESSPVTTPSPTPAASPDADQAATPQPSPTASGGPSDAKTSAPAAASGLSGWLLALLLLIVLAARILLTQPALRAARQKSEFGRWLVWTQAVHDAMRLMGLRRDSSETVTDFLRRAEASGRIGVSLRQLAEAETVMFYGHAEPEPAETRYARSLCRHLEQKLPPLQRIRLVLERAFLPRRIFDMTRS